MKNILIILLPALLFGCAETQNQNNTDNSIQSDTLISTDSLSAKKEYFYPEEEVEISKDTVVSGYKIRTTISPIKNKYQTLYTSDEKINYREYEIKIRIQNSQGDVITDRLIDKYEFDTIIDQNLSYYFIRYVMFVEFKNNEFRFDIKIGYTNHDYDNSYWIEYYISTEGIVRFKDQRTNCYKKVIENSKEETQQINAIITIPDTITNEDFIKYPITVLKDGDIWLLSEFGKKKFKLIEGDIKGFTRSKGEVWFYYLIDGIPQIYSVKLSRGKKIEWLATIKN